MVEELSNVYMSPESEVDNGISNLKERIRYFERIKAAMSREDANLRRPVIHAPAAITRMAKEHDNNNKVSNEPVSTADECNTVSNKSKIELLKEKFTKLKDDRFVNKERMEEVERVCKVKAEDEVVVEFTATKDEKEVEIRGNKDGITGVIDNEGILKIDSKNECETVGNISNEISTASEKKEKRMINNSNSEMEDWKDLKYNEITKVEVNLPKKDDILDEIISTEMDSMSFLDLEEFDLKLREKMVELDLEEEKLRCPKATCESDTNNSFSEIHERISENNVAVENSTEESKLPKSSDILNDFSKFKIRPALFNCDQLKTVDRTQSLNLYINCINKEYTNLSRDGMTITTPLFSNLHRKSTPVVFRAPGSVLETRPSLTVLNSIISENGVLYYLKVVHGNTSWIIIKSKENIQSLTMDASYKASINERINSMIDESFMAFILTDITTSVFRRTSYVFYNNQIVLLKFVGLSLCLCSANKCIKMIKLNKNVTKLHKLDSNEKSSFVIDGIVFSCSCAKERDEWYSTLESICL